MLEKTSTEIETAIYKKLVEIRKIARENGFSDYLTMSIVNDTIHFNNDYWEVHPNMPINFSERNK